MHGCNSVYFWYFREAKLGIITVAQLLADAELVRIDHFIRDDKWGRDRQRDIET